MRKVFLLFLVVFCMVGGSCDPSSSPPQPVSASGVQKASVKVDTDQNGNTIEQRNIARRLKTDNKPGSIKHLYIVSLYSGDVLLYSTVDGKVTSSGKRLTPVTVAADDGQYVNTDFKGFPVNIGGQAVRTGEVLQDDGTYGSSAEYVYWWDVRGVYHQQYVTGGMMVHISDQPIAFPKIIVNLEVAQVDAEQ